MADTKALIGLLDLLVDAIGVAADASKAGTISINDLPLLMRLIPDLGPALSNIGEIPAEVSALQAEDASALVQHVMAKLNIADAKALAVVDAALKMAVSSFALFKAIKG